MAVIESTSSVAVAKQTNAVYTKPTGLALGDLMLVFLLQSQDGTSGVMPASTTPAGWTENALASGTDGPNTPTRLQVFSRVAEAADVAASNFTFPVGIGTGGYSGGSMFRISNSAITPPTIFISGLDTTRNEFAAFTGSLNVAFDDSILFMALIGRDNGVADGTSDFTVSGTNPTWTERYDQNVQDADQDHQLAIASAPLAVGRTITTFGATWAESLVNRSLGVLIYVTTPADGAGTNALLSVSPTTFLNTGVVVGTAGTNVLLEPIPDMFSQSGRGETPTVWTPEVKTPATWAPEIK